MKFNYNHNNPEKFLNTPLSLVPSIKIYHLNHHFLKIENIDDNGYQNFTGNHNKIGYYLLKYNFVPNEMRWDCELKFALREDTKKMCFLITQISIVNNKETMNPMKFVSQDGKIYTYECKIDIDKLRNGVIYKMRIDILIYNI